MRKYELEVGTKNGEVIVNHPALDVDANGVGHIVFSPAQARGLAQSLLRQATIAEESGAASVIIRPTPPPILTTELFPYIGLDELGGIHGNGFSVISRDMHADEVIPAILRQVADEIEQQQRAKLN